MSTVAGPTEGPYSVEDAQTSGVPRCQATVANVATVEGFGYWSGKDVRVEFHPAEKDTGYIFVREDLKLPVSIPANVNFRMEMPRRTTLAEEDPPRDPPVPS